MVQLHARVLFAQVHLGQLPDWADGEGQGRGGQGEEAEIMKRRGRRRRRRERERERERGRDVLYSCPCIARIRVVAYVGLIESCPSFGEKRHKDERTPVTSVLYALFTTCVATCTHIGRFSLFLFQPAQHPRTGTRTQRYPVP